MPVRMGQEPLAALCEDRQPLLWLLSPSDCRWGALSSHGGSSGPASQEELPELQFHALCSSAMGSCLESTLSFPRDTLISSEAC